MVNCWKPRGGGGGASKALAACAALALAACSNGENAPTIVTPASLSIGEQIAAMDASGALPVLDQGPGLAGSDTNADGVRDDIGAFVAALPDTPPRKAGLVQLAKAFQASAVASATDSSAVTVAAAALNRAVACVYSVYDATAAHRGVVLLQELTFNTMPRIVAYNAFNAALNGSVAVYPTGAICD